MKAQTTYYHLSQLAFMLACAVGVNFAVSYLRLVHVNHWRAWQPGLGVAVLFAATVMCYVGLVWSRRDAAGSARFLPWCLGAFIMACTVGLNCALSYLHLVRSADWSAYRPGVGMALLFVSLLLSYVGYALAVQRAKPQTPGLAA